MPEVDYYAMSDDELHAIHCQECVPVYDEYEVEEYEDVR